MFKRLGNSLRRFMYGRYGTDQLNMALLITSLALSLLSSILSIFLSGSLAFSIIYLVLSLLIYAMLFFAIFRIFSRNIYRRRRENQKFLNGWNRIRARKHRYFRCPKCGEKFIKKT